MERKHWLLAAGLVIAAVAWCFVMTPTTTEAQYDWVKVDVQGDPPQGYDKMYQLSLEPTAAGITAEAGEVGLSMMHTSDAGYWFHAIGIVPVASWSTGSFVQWAILPYATTNDSTSIIATHLTVTYSTFDTAMPVIFPIKCYQFSTRLATPNTAVGYGATFSTAKAFRAIGYQKKHN